MDAHLRAGVAIYNAGHYHAAHDAWEDRWLALESGTDDERFLHGLIQFTAAVHHAQEANWAGLHGLADSGADYLDGLPEDYRDVNVGTVREYLQSVAVDPEFVERSAPPALTVAGRALDLDDLEFPAVAVAAVVLAEAGDDFDDTVVERAVEFAEGAGSDPSAGGDRFVALLGDFVREPARRGLVYQRLRAHVERRRAEIEDVDGLFD